MGERLGEQGRSGTSIRIEFALVWTPRRLSEAAAIRRGRPLFSMLAKGRILYDYSIRKQQGSSRLIIFRLGLARSVRFFTRC